MPCIDKPRATVSKYAPKMFQMKIDPDKIREVIGTGGKVINRIVQETNVKIDINDDGSIYIAAVDAENADKAMKIINGIVGELEAVSYTHLDVYKRQKQNGIKSLSGGI